MKTIIIVATLLNLTVLARANDVKQCRIVIDTAEKMTEQQRVAIHNCRFDDKEHLRYSADGKVVTIWLPKETYEEK